MLSVCVNLYVLAALTVPGLCCPRSGDLCVRVPVLPAAFAAPCNKILAQPGTITGSIGVIFMKLNVKDTLEEYGVTGDSVSLGENADWASGLHSLTPKQQQQVGQLLRRHEAPRALPCLSNGSTSCGGGSSTPRAASA